MLRTTEQPYCNLEIAAMLDLVEKTLPSNENEWNALALEFNRIVRLLNSDAPRRNGNCLQRKFNALQHDDRTSDAGSSRFQSWAKIAQRRIESKMEKEKEIEEAKKSADSISGKALKAAAGGAGGAVLGAAAVAGGFLLIGLTPAGPIAGGLFAANMGAGLASGSIMALAQSAAMTSGAYYAGAAVGAAAGATVAARSESN